MRKNRQEGKIALCRSGIICIFKSLAVWKSRENLSAWDKRKVKYIMELWLRNCSWKRTKFVFMAQRDGQHKVLSEKSKF